MSLYNIVTTGRSFDWRSDIPGVIQNISLYNSSAGITASWIAPVSIGSGILDYTLQWSTSSSFTSPTTRTQTGTLYNISSGITVGRRYYFRVRARNSEGSGEYSPTFSILRQNVPGVPIIALVAGNQQITVSITAPSTGGSSITGYRVQWRVDGGSYSSSNQADTTLTTYIITGLTNGTTYDVRVRASNSVGSGQYSADSMATPREPQAPSRVSSISITRSNTSLGLTASSVTGDTPITYQFQWKSGNQDYDSSRQKSSSSRSTSITGLTNGTQYTIRARAINSVGNGPWSNDFTGTPATTPGVPGFTLSAG